MAALEDFYQVPQLKHLFVKDGATGAKGFFDFDGVVSRLDSIEYDLSRIKGDIIEINEVGDNLEAALAEVTAALTEIKDIREELLAQFAALEQSTKEGLDAANGRIDALNAALGAAVNRITALEGVTAQLTARLDNLTADVTKLQKDLAALRADDAERNERAALYELQRYRGFLLQGDPHHDFRRSGHRREQGRFSRFSYQGSCHIHQGCVRRDRNI